MSAAWWRRRPPDDPAERLARQPTLLDPVIAALARAHGLSGRDSEELETFVRRRLAENDSAILREPQGEAALSTFLTVLVERLATEHRDELWARWREGAAAIGQAKVAATLERLVYDEARTFDEALRGAGVADDLEQRAELEALWARRPWGGRRPIADLKWQRLSGDVHEDHPPGTEILQLPRQPTDLERQLSAALQRLTSEERLVLNQRFAGGLSVEAIASWLGRPAGEVAQEIDVLLGRLRAELARAGIGVTDVAALLSDPRPGNPGTDAGG